MNNILEIQSVSKKFGDTIAVDNLSISLQQGEIFGFLGPNGAGKTTTIKMITGLLHPDSGNVNINGIDIRTNPTEAKQIIGYIPDNPYIYERLSGREFLELVGSLYKMDKKLISERIEMLFDLFGVDNWGDDFAAEYSHGMRQKIIMASAILHDPKIMIIDEPMVGLDPQSQRLTKKVFLKLAEKGITLFMSTHTLSVAEEICTKIGIIFKGKLLKLGSINELSNEAKSQNISLEELFVTLTGGEKEIQLW